MKYAVLAIGSVTATFAGCAKPQSYYQSSIAVAPTSEPHKYAVQFTMSENRAGSEPRMISAPRIIAAAGEQGEVKVCDSENLLHGREFDAIESHVEFRCPRISVGYSDSQTRFPP